MNARAAINKAYDGERNFMTPNLIGYVEAGTKGNPLCVELSWGTGIFSDKMYGVSVVTPEGERTELSSSFQTESEARAYIRSL